MIGEPPGWVFVALSVLSLALAVVSYRYVELPFRNRRRFTGRQILVASGVATVLLAGTGVVGVALEGVPSRFAVPESVASSMTRASTVCFDQDEVHTRPDWLCEIGLVGDTEEHPDFMFFGDSHSLSLVQAFSDVAESIGLRGAYVGASGCAPLLGIVALRADQAVRDCSALNRRVFDAAREMHVDRVVLVARWTYYTDGGYGGDDFSFIARSTTDERDERVSRDAFLHGLSETVRSYRRAGIELIVLEQVPEQRVHPESAYARAFGALGAAGVQDHLDQMSVLRVDHERLQEFVNTAFREQAALGALEYALTSTVFCADSICRIGDVDESFYFDDDHVSLGGAALLGDEIGALLGGRRSP